MRLRWSLIVRLRVERSLRPGLSLGLSLILACLLICPVLSGQAQTLTEVPPLTARVVDLTGTLDSNQQRALDQRLQAFEKTKGTQIAVLMVPGIGTEPIEQFALRVAERWKIGRKKIDDGALLVIAKNERRLRIEVGYGLEGALNDATSKRIIEEQIVPLFRRGDFYGGISAGIDAMMRVIEGEALPAPAPAPAPAENLQAGESGWLPLIFFAALIMSGLMRVMLGRVKGAIATGGILGVGAWLLSGVWILAIFSALIGLVITLAGGRMGSGWQGGRRHGGFNPYGGFGGGYGHSGGGFRGGGGGFGGGGASGRW